MQLQHSLTREALADLINLHTGLYRPLNGFMRRREHESVVAKMELLDGEVWPLPITLDVDESTFNRAHDADFLELPWQGKAVGKLAIEDCFVVDREPDACALFQTLTEAHPGVKNELRREPYRVGGKIEVTDSRLLNEAVWPERIRQVFEEKGWSTVVGFQTRNPIHRAHEYLQRIGMEVCDGLFINPLIGWKKPGDFSERAVMTAYEVMLDRFFPRERVHLSGLNTAMRYAGPREAIFHALLRRNCGCTHFIIGRDHAGVGGFYQAYAAHDLANEVSLRKDIGIELLLLKEPYYCRTCAQVVTEKSCAHVATKEAISGSRIRECFYAGQTPDPILMRPEISEALLSLGSELFIDI